MKSCSTVRSEPIEAFAPLTPDLLHVEGGVEMDATFDDKVERLRNTPVPVCCGLMIPGGNGKTLREGEAKNGGVPKPLPAPLLSPEQEELRRLQLLLAETARANRDEHDEDMRDLLDNETT
jgi:hypothetical protein